MPDSEPVSETSTLLDESTRLPSDDRIRDTDDKPILVEEFLKGVRLLKLLLIAPLISSCLLDALLIQAVVGGSAGLGGYGDIGLWRLICHAIALACRASSCLWLMKVSSNTAANSIGHHPSIPCHHIPPTHLTQSRPQPPAPRQLLPDSLSTPPSCFRR